MSSAEEWMYCSGDREKGLASEKNALMDWLHLSSDIKPKWRSIFLTRRWSVERESLCVHMESVPKEIGDESDLCSCADGHIIGIYRRELDICNFTEMLMGYHCPKLLPVTILCCQLPAEHHQTRQREEGASQIYC